MVEHKPGKWRWYHHAILVVAVLAFGILWNRLRPSDRVADVVLVACAIVVAFTVTAVRTRKRR